MHKVLISTVFCVALLSIVASAEKVPVNATWGARQRGDERLLYKILKKDCKWFWRTDFEDFDYPGKGAFSNANITYIEAINQKPDSGSSVTILKGGIGFPFVVLHFETSRTRGYNYLLQIYGKLNTQPQTQYVQPQIQYVGQPRPQYAQPPLQYAQPQPQYVQPVQPYYG